jgi:hypothetical protein
MRYSNIKRLGTPMLLAYHQTMSYPNHLVTGVIGMALSDEERKRRRSEVLKRFAARKRGEDVAFVTRGMGCVLPMEFRQWPGEADEDYKRRYARMKQARRRSDPAKKAEEAERRRLLYAERGEGEAKRSWKAANKDKVKAYARADFDRNREQKIANLKAWVKANPEKHKAAVNAWLEKNPGYKTAAAAKIRAKIIDRTPSWAEWRAIWRIYGAAKQLTKTTGIPHEVDHIVPLNGKNVSGLHVHYNLQVLPADVNRRKRNHHQEN